MKPTIAIIGSGLAGALLAEELAEWADVTVFERGGALPAHPSRPIVKRHPLGLYPSYAYGLGGTTNLWHGGLLAMRTGEYGKYWPQQVQEELEPYLVQVVRRFYGEEWVRSWKAIYDAADDSLAFLDVMIKPRQPFRVRQSNCFSRAHLRLGHRVQRLEEISNKVILYIENGSGVQSLAYDLVVISAGGMNSPLILRRSDIGGDQVGDNITDHPMGFVAKVTRGADRHGFDRLRGSSDTESMLKIYDDKSAIWSAFYLRPSTSPEFTTDPYADSFQALGSFGRVRKYCSALSKFGHSEFRAQAIAHLLRRPNIDLYANVLVLSEQEARGQGSVREDYSNAICIDWTVSDAVVSAIDRSLKVFAEWLGGKLHRVPGEMRKRLWSAAHHSGGCRIADDPRMGVVDSKLRVHGAERIFVCDGSVLPSTGASNTALTIGALALRLAAHLAPRSKCTRPTVRSGISPTVVVTGVTGHVGRMIEPALAGSGIPTTVLDVRTIYQNTEIEKASILIHLANASRSVQDNVRLQKITADLVSAAGIKNVIVPMSFATLEVPTKAAGDPEAFNLGFTSSARNEYIIGKLKSEELWLEWQRAMPGRSLQLLYIPTILGANSMWTQSVAGRCIGMAIWVPQIPHFFTVDEGQLKNVIVNICRTPNSAGVVRRVVVGQSGSLAEAIASDRGRETVFEFNAPRVIWWLYSSSKRNTKVRKTLELSRKVLDRILRQVARQAILPVAPEYYALFWDQANFDPKILNRFVEKYDLAALFDA